MSSIFTLSNKNQSKDVSLEDNASFLSLSFMTYLNPLFIKGASQDGIVHEDLGLTAEQDKCGNLYTEFVKHWEKEIP